MQFFWEFFGNSEEQGNSAISLPVATQAHTVMTDYQPIVTVGASRQDGLSTITMLNTYCCDGLAIHHDG
jgi:hypothetical protein